MVSSKPFSRPGKENVAWLNANDYRYVVVSRKRQRRLDPEQATLIKEADGVRIQAQRPVNADTGEVELYCHFTQRQKTGPILYFNRCPARSR